MQSKTYEGGCLCGAVRFEITGSFQRFFLCHCERCRKGSGSAHAANLFSTMAKIDWLSGEDKVRTYKVPDSRHMRAFCADCGSSLPRVQMNGALLVVPAGSLETAIDIRPEAHICTASRAQWDDHLEDVPKIKGMPG
ncbi:hypothetical protein C8N35_102262 [Breoghania corrubedonensis]|uniref:CENP-V/GFA domain-containing protein n=1 Tax=Breoghania corrubedonensis TaxID=665038 RepID=A0A2T5VCS0_9HYPH|nr:GFA family protein [Breoghania corrubedonensis]PTW61551.1 hypothetical protein C8N35_102262 [Breoghania corrubedonensis]